jgi:hypothetical protein
MNATNLLLRILCFDEETFDDSVFVFASCGIRLDVSELHAWVLGVSRNNPCLLVEFEPFG